MIRLLLIVLFLASPAFAQAPTYGPVDARNFGTTAFPATGSPKSQTAAFRAAAVYNATDYGAICNGSHHSVTSTLGISTISGLAAYTANGVTPYSWINNGQWNAEVALPMTVAATSGATTLNFDSALQIPTGATVTGTQIAGSTTVSAVSNPGTVTQVTNGSTPTIGTKSITVNSGTATPVGSHPTAQTGLSIDDYVVSSSATNVTLKYGITAASIASGTTLTFQPPSVITLNNAITANKPSVQSAASTATVNYWVYFSWPLTDAMVAAAEMDWLGTQAAIEAGTSATNGGKVQLPSGTCIMDNATVSGNAVGGVVVHESTTGGSLLATSSVDVVGNGFSNSYLSWPSEMGAGRVAISFGVPYATFDNGLGHYAAGNFYYGDLEGITFNGPNGQNGTTVGVINNRTWGIVAGARRELNNIVATGFYVGATFENVDHTRWSNVFLNSNSMGLRLGPAGKFLYGDDVISHLEITGNSLADISIDKSGYWQATNIDKLYCAFAPKCIRLEPGSQDSYGQPTGVTMSASTIENTNGEDLGGCFICDDNYGPNAVVGASLAGGELTMQNMDFEKLGFSYNATYQPSGSPIQFWLEIPQAYATKFQFQYFNPQPVAGMQGAVFIDVPGFGLGGVSFEGAFTSLLSSGTWNTKPFFALYGAGFNNAQYNIRVCQTGSWCGHVEYSSSASPVQGTPLEYTQTGSYGFLEVQPAAGTNPFGGINMTAATTVGGTTVVATKFCWSSNNSVTIPTSGTATAGHLAALATGGTITNGTNDTGVIIGTIMKVSGAAADVSVGTNGSCD